MKPTFLNISAFIALICAFSIIFFIQTSRASTLQEQKSALNMIADFAERFCKDIPIEGNDESIELTGKAKAELNGIISKLANVGVEGAAKYQDQKYKGVLQKDLATALRNNTNCKLTIWNDLKDRLLPKNQYINNNPNPNSASGRNTQTETLSSTIKDLKNPNVSIRISAAIKLEKMGPDAAPAFSDLVHALNDKDLMFVEKVVDALSAIDSVAAKPYLIKLNDRLYQQRGGEMIDGSKPEDSLLGTLLIILNQ